MNPQYFQPYGQPNFQQPFMPTIPTNSPVTTPLSTLNGRIVKSVEEIVPNEVPMNGSVGIFPMADMSSIFVKGWNQDGTISTAIFKPVTTEEVEEKPSVTLFDIMDQLSDIQDLLKAEKPATTKKPATRKKAADDDE